MNVNTAKQMISTLSTGTFAGSDWISPSRANVYFKGAYARDAVADYGQLLGSGQRTEEKVIVTDPQFLRALRKINQKVTA